jgi:hypothetical protein
MLELALHEVRKLETENEREFARSAILRVGQWALDCREEIPTADEIRRQFLLAVSDMLCGARIMQRGQEGRGAQTCSSFTVP